MRIAPVDCRTSTISGHLRLPVHVSFQEISDSARDLLDVCFECKVPGIVEVNVRIRVVTPKGLRACGQKERIVLTPDCEQRRLLCPEILLEFRVKGDIACV